MKFIILSTIAISLFVSAEEVALTGSWKATPIVKNGETIERKETLVINSDTYERTIGDEKRSGVLKCQFVPDEGPIIWFGTEPYGYAVSKDYKTLTLFKVSPERRVGNASEPARIQKTPDIIFSRVGEPDWIKIKANTGNRDGVLKSTWFEIIQAEMCHKYNRDTTAKAKQDSHDRIEMELLAFKKRNNVTDLEIGNYQKTHAVEIEATRQKQDAVFRTQKPNQ